MDDWELRRRVSTRSNLYDRAGDPEGGQAVVYGDQDMRECFGYVNGAWFIVPFPDTATKDQPDRGLPVAVRLRYDHSAAAWFLYAYVFSGDSNPRSEWVRQIA